ncbi:hypothetical protein [Devosia beringensis]|uniref:hypothetical protein n=1 Tax=Devosia beringensis TaxID=2657486 RepID=UPI00186BA143|nr:hypothetical protein [Devosia beringensis]
MAVCLNGQHFGEILGVYGVFFADDGVDKPRKNPQIVQIGIHLASTLCSGLDERYENLKHKDGQPCRHSVTGMNA